MPRHALAVCGFVQVAFSSGSHRRRATKLTQLLLRAFGAGRVFGSYPVERRSSGDEQPRDADMVGTVLTRVMTPSFGCPDQRRGGKHAVERIDRCAVGEKDAGRFRATRHRGPMQCRDTIVIFSVRIETVG